MATNILTCRYLAAARTALLRRSPSAAYAFAVEGLNRGGEASPLCLAAAEAMREMGSPAPAEYFEAVAEAPESASAWIELGNYICLGEETTLAITIFARALRLDETSLEAATSLAFAHAAVSDPFHGRYVLAGRPLVDFRSRFAMAWCSLLCGELDGADQFVERARHDLRRAGGQHARQFASWIDGFEECVARFARVGDPRKHVRDWHFIQFGAAVLDCCEVTGIAGGRYVTAWPSYRDLALRLLKLRALLLALDRRPAVVVSPEGRDCQILGRAAADILQIGFATASALNVAQDRILIVASNARELALAVLPLRKVYRAQTVFAMELNCLWPGGAVVPDVTGIVTQEWSKLPWGLEPDRPFDETFEPARDQSIVRRIVRACEPINLSFSEVIGRYRPWEPDLKGRHQGQRRLAFTRDSPVPIAPASWLADSEDESDG